MRLSYFLFFLLLASTATAQTNPLPNPGFENWSLLGFPDGYITNSTLTQKPIFRSSDAHSGSFAMGGTVIQSGDTTINPVATTGTSFNGIKKYGFPINFLPAKFEAWYKATLTPGDLFEIRIDFFSHGQAAGTVDYVDSLGTLGYTPINEPIANLTMQVPDSGNMTVGIYNVGGHSHVGSTFVLDDVAILSSGQAVSTTSEHSSLLGINYPNPFRSITSIPFSTLKSGYCKLEVLDMIGRKVVTLVNGYEAAGEHKATFSSGDLPSGIYCLKFTDSSGEQSCRYVQLAR